MKMEKYLIFLVALGEGKQELLRYSDKIIHSAMQARNWRRVILYLLAFIKIVTAYLLQRNFH